MNTALQSLKRNWFRKDSDMPNDGESDIPHPLPQIAMMPVPEQTDEEKRLTVIANAHTFVEQIKQERLSDRRTIEQLQAEIGIITHDLQGERIKSGLLELDLATAENNTQAIQADLEEKDRCLSLLRQVLDKFGTKAPPKKERKPRAKKKTGRKEKTEAAKAEDSA